MSGHSRNTQLPRAGQHLRAWPPPSGRFFVAHAHSHPNHPRARHRQWHTRHACVGALPRPTLPSPGNVGARWELQFQIQGPRATIVGCKARWPRPPRLTFRSRRRPSGAPELHVGRHEERGAASFQGKRSRPQVRHRSQQADSARPAILVCPRRSNIDPPCRSNIDPGMDADRVRVGCG